MRIAGFLQCNLVLVNREQDFLRKVFGKRTIETDESNEPWLNLHTEH